MSPSRIPFLRWEYTLGYSPDLQDHFNPLNASATCERRETEATNITELTYGANVGLNRTFNARSSGNVGLNYQFTDFGTADQRTSTQTSLSSAVSYRLAGDVLLSFSHNLTLRRINNENSDLTENSVTLGLSKRF